MKQFIQRWWERFWQWWLDEPPYEPPDFLFLTEWVQKQEPFYRQIASNWLTVAQKVHEWGGRVTFKVSEPATPAEVEELEEKLGYPLPPLVRQLLLHFAKEVYIHYSLPFTAIENIAPFADEGIMPCGLGWTFHEFIGLDELREEAVREGPCPERADLFYFSGINGDDYIAINRDSGEISYLFWSCNDHYAVDGIKINNHIFARDLNEFLLTYSQIGCPDMMHFYLFQFLNPQTHLLDSTTELAVAWQKIWGLSKTS